MSFGCAPTAIAAAMPKCFRSWNRNAGRKRRLPPRFSHSPSPSVWSVGTHSRLRKFVLDNEPPSPPRKIKSPLDSTGNARAGGQPRREGGHHAGERHEQASDLGAARPRGAAGLPRSRSPARQLAFASTERGQALYSRIGTHRRTRPTAVRQGACRADRRSDGAGSRFGTPARRDTTPARAFQIPSLICGRGQRFKSSTHQQFPCVKRVRRDPRLRSRRPIGPIDQRSPRKVSRSTE